MSECHRSSRRCGSRAPSRARHIASQSYSLFHFERERVVRRLWCVEGFATFFRRAQEACVRGSFRETKSIAFQLGETLERELLSRQRRYFVSRTFKYATRSYASRWEAPGALTCARLARTPRSKTNSGGGLYLSEFSLSFGETRHSSSPFFFVRFLFFHRMCAFCRS